MCNDLIEVVLRKLLSIVIVTFQRSGEVVKKNDNAGSD